MQFNEAIRVVAIHQPNYLPWLGFISKIACSDAFVLLDNVQYNKRTFHHRSRYSTDQGLRWLSLSVQSKGTWENKTKIKDVKMAPEQATVNHFKTLWHRYGKTPGWRNIGDRLEAVLDREYDYMIDASLATIDLTLDIFKIKPEFRMASDVNGIGAKGDLMLSLTQEMGGDYYLSGSGARDYLDQEIFRRSQVGISFQNFLHPQWKQSVQGPFQESAFALEWYLEEPNNAVERFHSHLFEIKDQRPRCLL